MDSGVEPASAPALKARVAGLDPATGRDMPAAEQVTLGDWFAINLLRRGKFPRTLRELSAAIDALNPSADPRPQENVFVIAETGQLRWSAETAGVPRGVRYAISRGTAGNFDVDVLVSTRPPSDSLDAFLQVASWDKTARQFNFYERIGVDWFWEGNSWMALEPPTRGKGPFDSHVNGALVMKELVRPWQHWDSTSQSIPLDSFPPDHPVAVDPYFARRQPAHLLETTVVRPAVERWSEARLDRVLTAGGGIAEPSHLLRHLLTPTSVNIVSSDQRSNDDATSVGIPFDLFYDRTLFDALELPIDLAPLHLERPHYVAAVALLGMHLRAGSIRQDGETYFAAAVPARAFEDNVIVKSLLQRGVLSRQLVLAIAMLDFTEPLASAARASVMALVPPGPVPPADLDARLRDAITAAAKGAPAQSPLRACAADLVLSEANLVQRSLSRFEEFWSHVLAKAATKEGTVDIFRLIDSRRRQFRRRPLVAEVNLSLPASDVAFDAPFLRLSETAELEPSESFVA